MAAFLSGEMKDTVQMHPAGAYGSFVLFQLFVDNFSYPIISSRALLLSPRTTEAFPELGGQCKHVDKSKSRHSPLSCQLYYNYNLI